MIPSSSDRRSLPLSVPENLTGEVTLELDSVHGCLIDNSHKRVRALVVPPMHDLRFERREYSVEDPGKDKLRVSTLINLPADYIFINASLATIQCLSLE